MAFGFLLGISIAQSHEFFRLRGCVFACKSTDRFACDLVDHRVSAFYFYKPGHICFNLLRYLKLFCRSQQRCSTTNNRYNGTCCYYAAGRCSIHKSLSYLVWKPIFDFEHLAAVIHLLLWFLIQ